MRRRDMAWFVLATAGALAACEPTTVSTLAPSPSATAATSNGSASAAPSSSDGGGAIDPDWVTRPALTCGDRKRLFPLDAPAGLGLAELGLDPAAAVLRTTIADTPDYLPNSGWHRVRDDPDGVMFVAPGNAETPWFEVTVGLFDGVLQPVILGQCHLAIAAPPGVTFASWWLDPAGPPMRPDRTEVAILLREQDCASGKSPEGRVLVPTIVTTADAFEVVIGIREQLTDQDCPANPAYPMRLLLPEPLGARGLFDAHEFPPRRVTTQDPG